MEEEEEGMGCWCAEREDVCSCRSSALGPLLPALLPLVSNLVPSLDPLPLAAEDPFLPALPTVGADAEAGRERETTTAPPGAWRMVYFAT
jgi:hypothetical protein